MMTIGGVSKWEPSIIDSSTASNKNCNSNSSMNGVNKLEIIIRV